jgi:signal transduction histidine kinase
MGDQRQEERDSARLLAQLVEAQQLAHIGSWERNLVSGTTIYSEELFKLIYGADLPAVPTFENFLAQVHPEDRERVRRFREGETAGTIANRDIEYRVQHRDGTVHMLHSRSEVTHDASGRALRVFGTAMEITDRWRAAEDLDKTRRLLLQSELLGRVGSWEYDLITGEVLATEGNRRLFFGDDRSKGSRFEDYIAVNHPEDREWVDRRRQNVVDGEDAREIEYRIVWPDGSVHVIQGLVQQVIRDAAGRPVRAFGTNADVTERKRVEEELDRRVRQQAAVAQLGQTALHAIGLQALLDKAVDLVARNCNADFAEVAELLPDQTLLLRAAVGWKEGLVGHATLPAGTGTLCAYTLRSDAPSVVEDFARETRFSVDPLILEQGIVSDVTVLIRSEGRPFGTLGVGTRLRRNFTLDDIHFLESMANVLAAAIERERTAGALRQKGEQLQSLSRKLIEAQEAERRAIARELHDDFGQVLAAIRLTLDRSAQPAEQGSADAIALIDEAIGRLRDLALDLRPPVLDDLGLAPALRWYVSREAKRARLDVELDVNSLQSRPPPAVETTCFRVTQEALNNVVRHAGARHVHVSLRATGGDLLLLVRDDGKGFDVPAARRRAAAGASQGLLTMEERVSLAGGMLSIDSAAGQGTQVRARFPPQIRSGS